jgi:adenylate cyclase
MTSTKILSAAPARRRAPFLTLRRVRLGTGLVLFAYVTLHFLNHALGNISVDAMEKGLAVQKFIWQSRPGALVLYASVLIHMSLGFWALFERRQFRWTRLEATQLVLGLSIPFLLTDHVFGTRVSLSAFGTDKGYAEELLKFWVRSPGSGVLQTLAIVIVWIHGCIGVHFWLALKPFYPRVRNVLLAAAVLVPTLALLGYFQGGRQILSDVRDTAWQARHLTPHHVGAADQNARLLDWRSETLVALAAILVATFLARGARRWTEQRLGSILLTYPERSIRAKRGLSVLEASLLNDIPHAHVCGGRGRCSTCRIRILRDFDALPPISAAEQAVLERIGAGADVRLACQLRPTDDLAFVPLIPANATISEVRRRGPVRSGDERYVAVMFVDMRGSSKLAEGRLPYDTVFIINQFLNAVSGAVVESGGQPNQIIGDGLLALFGLAEPPDTACRQAVAACAAIAGKVERLNESLALDLGEPIRFGVGVNAGLVVAGDIGYERHAQFTVIGDAVNVAARLQDLTKALRCEVLMSEEVYTRAGFGPDDLPAREVDARGREEVVKARIAAKAADLSAYLEEKAA